MSDPAQQPLQSTLRLVDPTTGEIHPNACPECAKKQHALDEWAKKYHGVLSQLGKLRADKEAEAQASKYWPVAVSLFTDWRAATGRINSKWNADRFLLCQPFLEADGYAICRYAVWGLAAAPNTKQITKGYQEVYDDWELCFRNRATFERYARRGRAIFGADLPITDIDQLLHVHRRRAGVK